MSDTFKARCDQAVAARQHRTLRDGPTSQKDIEEAFERAGLKPKRPAPEMPFIEEVYGINGQQIVVESGVHRWFLATFAPRLFEKVTRGCAEKGWVFTCPKQKIWKAALRPKPGAPRRIAVEQPLFGTYGFLRPETNDPKKIDFPALDHIDGLGGLVRRPMTKEPVFLPLGEVEKFLRLEEEGFFDQTRARPPKVKREDQVRITSGFFEGKRGFVSMTTGERVKVLLGMLGQIELPVDQVELCA